jgi:uncharacterized protein (DUF1015 family)
MPEIKSFRAWRYNHKKIKNLSKVVAPPYDVISKADQKKLYDANPYNVIRLELGQTFPSDTPQNNRYTRAYDTLKDWKHESVLVQEEYPVIYVHEQQYLEEGQKKKRIGFFAAMKLDEKSVLKHENTLAGPKEDRLHLLKEVRTNLSPIFGLFEDSKGIVQKLLLPATRKKAIVDVVVSGVRHKLFIEDRREVAAQIAEVMKPKPMFIADGHHRFEVATQFKKWMHTQTGGREGAWDYVFTYFSDCLHNPFKIFPTHRLIKVKKGQNFLKPLDKLGKVEIAKDLKEVLARLAKCRDEEKDKSYRFGFYTAKDGFRLLKLDAKVAQSIASNPVAKLDVAVLHDKIIAPGYGIHAIEKSELIDFTRDAEEAVQKVKSGDFDLAIFLRPTSLKEMLYVSKKGLKMPQKSTYFYPKLLTGLLFYGMSNDQA